MKPLDDLINEVWNPDVRPLINEAKVAYEAGAFRACIVLTWVGVASDLLSKIARLSEDGPNALAKSITDTVHGAAPQQPESIAQLQRVERELLDSAVKFELIDPLAKRLLERLRDDRHLCAHPSMDPVNGFYSPNAETARCHLSNAIETSLAHPPMQGRQAVERFSEHLKGANFEPDYARSIFLNRTSGATRRNIVSVAAKHALLALPVKDDTALTARVAANSAAALQSFAETERQLVSVSIGAVQDRLHLLDDAGLLGATQRLGDLDVFWDKLDPVQLSRLSQLIASIHPDGSQPFESEIEPKILGLCAVRIARLKIPALVAGFKRLSSSQRANVIALRPDPYFAAEAASLLSDAGSWRVAETVTRIAVLPLARTFTEPQLAEVLNEWHSNDQCLLASGMVGFSANLYAETRHLLPYSSATWQQFLDKVQAAEPKGWYAYEQLAELLSAESNKQQPAP